MLARDCQQALRVTYGSKVTRLDDATEALAWRRIDRVFRPDITSSQSITALGVLGTKLYDPLIVVDGLIQIRFVPQLVGHVQPDQQTPVQQGIVCNTQSEVLRQIHLHIRSHLRGPGFKMNALSNVNDCFVW